MRAALIATLLCACSSGGAEDCVKLASQARAFAINKLDQLGEGCSRDDECALIAARLSCYTGCPRAVLQSRLSGAQGELDGLSATICGSSSCSVNDGCTVVHTACVIGRCRTVDGPGGADAGSPDGG